MGCAWLLYNDCFYMFRLMFLTFFQEFRGTAEQKKHQRKSFFDHSFDCFSNWLHRWYDWFAWKQLVESLFDSNLLKLATAEHQELQNIS
jgi:hypothetical protein